MVQNFAVFVDRVATAKIKTTKFQWVEKMMTKYCFARSSAQDDYFLYCKKLLGVFWGQKVSSLSVVSK